MNETQDIVAAAAPAEGPTLRKKELFDRVAVASGSKRKDVRQITEAVLSVIGAALAQGEDLNLPPLGKMRIVKQKDLASGAGVLTIKLRLPGAAGPTETAKPPLADADD